MALQHVFEKLSGSASSLTLPVFVYDDGTPPAEISLTEVMDHIDAAVDIPAIVIGLPNDGDPGITRLSKSAWRIEIRYGSRRPFAPPTVGEERFGFNFNLPRKYVRWAPEVGRFPASQPTWHGLVNVVQDGSSLSVHSGVWLDPPAVSFSKQLTVPASAVTGTWVRTLATVIQAGTVNSEPLQGGAYAPGEIIIVQCNGRLISEEAFSIDISWNWAQNVSNETRDAVENVSYQGQDFVWDWTEPFADRNGNQLGLRTRATYVNRVRPRGDLSAIGIIPP